MLLPEDADLVRRDPAIPGLARLLDPESLLEVLGACLPELPVGALRTTYVKYKPGRYCRMGYQMGGGHAALSFYATARGAGWRPRSDGNEPAAGKQGAPRRALLPDEGVAVQVFPYDRRLPALSQLASPKTRRQLLAELAPDDPGLWRARVRCLRYRPERRYVARAGTRRRAVLKFYTETGYAEACRATGLLESRELLRVPRRLGGSERHHALALEWLPGTLLLDILGRPRLALGVMGRVALALAELHEQSGRGLPLRTPGDHAAALSSIADWVAFTCPHLGELARRLAERIAAGLADQAPADRVLHGDMSARQILVTRDRVGLIDFDEACRGDPAADLGALCARLERNALHEAVPLASLESIRRALLDGYAAATRRPLPVAVALYTAAGLFRLATHPFQKREKDWPVRTEQLLECAEKALGGTLRGAGC